MEEKARLEMDIAQLKMVINKVIFIPIVYIIVCLLNIFI